MFLDKGNDSNLEGKVTVYSEFYDMDSQDPLYVGFYASTDFHDIEDISQKIISEESLRYNDFNDDGEECLGFYEEDFFILELGTNSVKDLPFDKGDVMFAGASFRHDLALKKADDSLDEYIRIYVEQITGLLPHIDYYYKIFPGNFLKPAIMNHYLKPLIIAIKRGNGKLKNAIIDRLELFTGYQFHNGVSSLVESVHDYYQNSSPKSIKLVRYNLNKLIAVCQEDYGEAAVLRDKIKKIKPLSDFNADY